MKKRYLIGIGFLILLSQSLFVYSLLEEGYPFLGRFIDDNDDGVGGLRLNIVFDECISRELVTDSDGEFVLTINNELDIFYKNNKNKSCLKDIYAKDPFYTLINKSVIGCDKKEAYGNFIAGSSAGAIGTHKIINCTVEEETEYVKPVPGGGGGGGGGEKPARTADSPIILVESEVNDFIKKIEENKQKQEEKKVIEEKPLLKRIGLPSIALSQNYIIMIFLILLIIDLVILIACIKARNKELDKDFDDRLE